MLDHVRNLGNPVVGHYVFGSKSSRKDKRRVVSFSGQTGTTAEHDTRGVFDMGASRELM